MARKPDGPLRRGWTTGACATAATKAAYTALLTSEFPDPVSILLPKGERPDFVLAREALGDDAASAAIVKDAGDDPDVTHLATIVSTVRIGAPGSGVVFRAGEGVGMGTREGLPIPRLGIVGGLSILGTTGVVIPFSCSAWIHSIHRGIDVARAGGFPLVAACTGSTSEAAVVRRHGLDETALLDMGDFVGGMLKYLRRHPLPKVLIGGGFAKLAKLAQGHMDLHSGRSQVDMDWLAEQLAAVGGDAGLVERAKVANTALEVLNMALEAGLPLANRIGELARAEAAAMVAGTETEIIVEVFDRKGNLVGAAGEV